MKNDDIHDLMNHLQDATTKLPLYRADLRKRLLTIHPAGRVARRTKSLSPSARVATGSRRALRIGLVIMTMLIMLLSLLMILPTAGGTSNRKLVDTPPSAASVHDQLSVRSGAPAKKSAVPTAEKPAAAENNNIKVMETAPAPIPSASPSSTARAPSAPPESSDPKSEPPAAVGVSTVDPEDRANNPGNGPKKDKAPGENADKKKDKEANGNKLKTSKHVAQPVN